MLCPAGSWCHPRSSLRAAFPERVGRTGIARLELLLGKYSFEGAVQIPGGVGGPIRIIHVLL